MTVLARSRRQLEMIAAYRGCQISDLAEVDRNFIDADDMKKWLAMEKAAQLYHNHNPPTVYVGLVWIGKTYKGGLMVGRRADKNAPGFDQLALIGGYQEMGEDWATCLSREHFEETGMKFDPERWHIWGDPVSVEGGTKNLVFCYYKMKFKDNGQPRNGSTGIKLDRFVPSKEISELISWTPTAGIDGRYDRERELEKWAFPAHFAVAEEYQQFMAD